MKQIRLSIIALTMAVFVFGVALAEEKKAEKNTYPLKTCVVSGEKLGEMGDPYVYKHEGREVKFCCKSCLKDFKKAPSEYVKKLDQAEQAAKK